MSRIPAILVSALIALTPVVAALCADGCIGVGRARSTEVVETCGHLDGPGGSAAVRAAACAPAQTDIAVAEARIVGPSIAPAQGPDETATEPLGRTPHERYLEHQPPPASARVILRI